MCLLLPVRVKSFKQVLIKANSSALTNFHFLSDIFEFFLKDFYIKSSVAYNNDCSYLLALTVLSKHSCESNPLR